MFHRVDEHHRVVEVQSDGNGFARDDEGGAGFGRAAVAGGPLDDGLASDAAGMTGAADGLDSGAAPEPLPVEGVRRERTH